MQNFSLFPHFTPILYDRYIDVPYAYQNWKLPPNFALDGFVEIIHKETILSELTEYRVVSQTAR